MEDPKMWECLLQCYCMLMELVKLKHVRQHTISDNSIINGNKSLYYYCPQRSSGKVMFSQLCVKNSVLRGGVSQHALGQTPPCPVHAGIHTPPGRHTLPGRHPQGRHTHPPTATAADDTHPTGMHSCYLVSTVFDGFELH